MTSPDDETLARQLAATLDRAAAAPDPELQRRVQAALADARPAVRRRPGTWAAAGMALAAGLAALVWLPLSPSGSGQPVATVPAPVIAAAPGVEPDFLEDLELVAVLGEDPDES